MIRNCIYILILLFGFTSCGRVEEENTVYYQTDEIKEYLDGLNVEYSVRDYLYIVNLSTESKSGMAIVETGDSVYINYAQYTFDSGIGDLFSTNIESIAQAEDIPFVGDFEPIGIKYGTTDIIDGLSMGLRGLNQSDSVMLFMPSDLAYKDQYIGVVEPYSSVVMFVEVNKIVKK